MSVQTPAERLEVVSGLAALRWRTEPVLLPSDSNDTWSIDEPSRGAAVLRVAWRGDRGRLVTEAKVGRALPRAVGYPEVLGFGWTRDEADLTWVLSRRLDGTTLAAAWPALSERQRADACVQTADRLARLHTWQPSGAISDRLLVHDGDTSVSGLIGATINPLPVGRFRALVAAAEPSADRRDLLREALAWLERHPELAPEWDRPGLAVVHGDLHLDNVWWDGERVGGLLDLEWVRRAPAWVDLARIADQFAHPTLGEAHRQLFETLAPSVEVPELDDRLRYARIAFQARQVLVWGDGSDESDGDPQHPVEQLSELLG